MKNIKSNRYNREKLSTANDMLDEKYGSIGTPKRNAFDAKAEAWYLTDILKDKRKQKRWSQARLAAAIGKKTEFIARLEDGEADIKLDTFLAMSRVLGVKTEDIKGITFK